MSAVAVHGPEAVQAAPWVHAVHTPLALQTPVVAPEVQAAPTAMKVRSVQAGAPDEQSMVAVAAQGLAEVHVASWVQAAHTPAVLHTPLVVPCVQAVPTVAYVWSVHTGAPLVQTMEAVAAQAFVEVQAAPDVQALQVPGASHTPVPPAAGVQALPTGRTDSTVQTGPVAVQVYEAVAAHVFDETQAPPQRTYCQVARMVPFCELVQSMV